MCWNYYGGFRCYPRNPCEAPYTKTSEKSVNTVNELNFYPCIDNCHWKLLEIACLQSVHLPIPGWLSESPAVDCLQIHEHPVRPDCANGHLPDSGHQHLCQHTQHLQDQIWEWRGRVFPASKSIFLSHEKLGEDSQTVEKMQFNVQII